LCNNSVQIFTCNIKEINIYLTKGFSLSMFAFHENNWSQRGALSCLERLQFPLQELQVNVCITSVELLRRLLALFANTLEKLTMTQETLLNIAVDFPFEISLNQLTYLNLRLFKNIPDLTFLKLIPNLKTLILGRPEILGC